MQRTQTLLAKDNEVIEVLLRNRLIEALEIRHGVRRLDRSTTESNTCNVECRFGKLRLFAIVIEHKDRRRHLRFMQM